jgi:hypothetical protein
MDLNVVRMSFAKKVFSRDIRISVLRSGIRVTTAPRKASLPAVIWSSRGYFAEGEHRKNRIRECFCLC